MSDRSGWLERIDGRLSSNQYVFSTAPTFDVPKGHLATRPGVSIHLDDQLVYHGLALACLPQVSDRLRWSEYTVRFSYRLRDDGSTWFKQSFAGWRNFDRVSLGKLRDSFRYVVTTDIAAYYENIDIRRLILALRSDVAPEAACNALSEALHKWSGPRERGIPQAYAPSHMLGEYFLDDVDRELKAEGITHLRYLDDIRLFASTRVQAQRHLDTLARLLRSRGLNLQTAKTELLSRAEARKRFRRVHAAVTRASRRIAAQIADLDPYISPEALQEFLQTDPDNPRPEVVEEAWKDFVARRLDFTPTVLHYLLARLSEVRSPVAVDYTIGLLQNRPEETSYVLRYLTILRQQIAPSNLLEIAKTAMSQDTVYDYQRYQIIRWFLDNDARLSELLDFCRSAINPGAAHRIVRPYAIAYLAHCTSEPHDFERLERTLADETDELARATLIHSLRKAPTAIRSRVLGRCKGESWLIDRAISCPMQV